MLLPRLLVLTFAMLSACSRSADEAKVIGVWQCNPQNGTIWRMTFAPDHTLALALPHDQTVDSNRRDAKFDFFMSGTWYLDGSDLVYTIEQKEGEVLKAVTRISLSKFENTPPFGTDPNYYLERL